MIEFGVIVAVLVGIAQVVKQLGLPAKYVPLFNLVLGIVAGLVAVDAPTVAEQVIFGAIFGLSASGLYDQSKIVTKE